MKYLTTCTLLFFITAAHAETPIAVSVIGSSAVSNDNSIKQATQSIARKLVMLLGLTTVSGAEKDTSSLKEVVLKALQEGKPMSEIRLATEKAVGEVTGQVSKLDKASSETPQPSNVVNQQSAGKVEIVANPAEITLNSETGKMMAVVQPGESIFRLAQRVYGQENGRMYIKIFAANTENIKDINVVVEGQQLVMP